MADSPSPPALNRRIGEWLLRQNVLYLLSACLMLLGCYLISLPNLLAFRRNISELLLLLGVINIYEGLVILACGFILRRLPKSREGALLLLVEFLFLFDMTCTANACLSRNFKLGLCVAAGSFVLALLKLLALEIGARHTLFQGLKRVLVGALLLLYSLQGVLVLYSPETPQFSAASAYAVWLALGVLALLLPPTRNAQSEDASPPPWCTTVSFQRVIGGMAFGLVALQVAGQSWVTRAPFELSFALPALCAWLATAPFFLSRSSARKWADERAALLVALCALGLYFGSDFSWGIKSRHIPAMTPVRVNLFFGALAAAIMLWRERSAWHAHAACLLLTAGTIGTDFAALRDFCAQPSLLQFAASLLIAAAWVAVCPNFHRAVIVYLAELALLLRYFQSGSPAWDFLRWSLLGTMALCLLFNYRPRHVWFGLQTAVFACGAWSCHPNDGADLAYFYAAASAWNYLAAREWRTYGPVVLAYLLISESNLIAQGLPPLTIRWGWLVVLLAFASFGIAFRLTRQTLARKGVADSMNNIDSTWVS